MRGQGAVQRGSVYGWSGQPPIRHRRVDDVGTSGAVSQEHTYGSNRAATGQRLDARPLRRTQFSGRNVEHVVLNVAETPPHALLTRHTAAWNGLGATALDLFAVDHDGNNLDGRCVAVNVCNVFDGHIARRRLRICRAGEELLQGPMQGGGGGQTTLGKAHACQNAFEQLGAQMHIQHMLQPIWLRTAMPSIGWVAHRRWNTLH